MPFVHITWFSAVNMGSYLYVLLGKYILYIQTHFCSSRLGLFKRVPFHDLKCFRWWWSQKSTRMVSLKQNSKFFEHLSTTHYYHSLWTGHEHWYVDYQILLHSQNIIISLQSYIFRMFTIWQIGHGVWSDILLSRCRIPSVVSISIIDLECNMQNYFNSFK